MSERKVGGCDQPHQVEAVAAWLAVGQKDGRPAWGSCNNLTVQHLVQPDSFVVKIVWRFNVEMQQILQIINFGQIPSLLVKYHSELGRLSSANSIVNKQDLAGS